MLEKIFSVKSILIFCVICLLLIVGIIVWLFFHVSQNPAPTSSETTTSSNLTKQREETGGSVSTEKLNEYKQEGLNPFGSTLKINQLTDEVYQEYIHGMSHQKVKADEKWGFYQINDERIQWLLKGLDKNKLEHADLYREILTRWAKGDFSKAVEDHNAIWRLQGGNIGRATGLLSPEEEKAYVESHK